MGSVIGTDNKKGKVHNIKALRMAKTILKKEFAKKNYAQAKTEKESHE